MTRILTIVLKIHTKIMCLKQLKRLKGFLKKCATLCLMSFVQDISKAKKPFKTQRGERLVRKNHKSITFAFCGNFSAIFIILRNKKEKNRRKIIQDFLASLQWNKAIQRGQRIHWNFFFSLIKFFYFFLKFKEINLEIPAIFFFLFFW